MRSLTTPQIVFNDHSYSEKLKNFSSLIHQVDEMNKK